jgi:hypothetical protein
MNCRLLLAAGAALALAAPARAQDMPESYRAVQMRALELQRRSALAMADSMPERLYRDKVTPIQRDFAQQLGHVAGSMGFVVSQFVGVPGPQLPDTAVAFNSRAGMRSYINAAYDWAAGVLRNQTAADRAVMVTVFGTPMAKWQVWDEMHQHTFWTLGQVVANFRKNGMAPPGFGFF